jgi:superoxide dismutase, Cu-Zn family
MRTSRLSCLFAVAAALAAGCASDASRHAEADHHAEAAAAPAPAPHPLSALTEAVAVVHPTTGNAAHGVVHFTQTAEGMHVTAEIEGLKPNAKHAFHIHEFGDCTSGDGKSAGAHYNPGGHDHAGPDAPMRHAGDLGNLETDANGVAHYDRTVTGLTVGAETNPILGRAVIVHAKEDDFTTQPTGNAGDRIACGVIGVAKPAAK